MIDVFQYQNMSDPNLGDMAAQTDDLHVADPGVNGKVCAWLQQAQDPDSCTQGILNLVLPIIGLFLNIQYIVLNIFDESNHKS